MKPLRRVLFFAYALVFPVAAVGAQTSCRNLEESGASYTVCAFDARSDAIRLFLSDDKDEVYGSFSALSSALAREGRTLAFAMNAGMYDETHRPVGLYVEDGRMLKRANIRSGTGNFHMKPNGVFWVQGARAGVTETQRFLKERLRPAYATQSGPMLVLGGRINPRIHETGTSEKIRNGVGVRDGHAVVFAISDRPVTFYAFARLFRERLKCPDALFLDGSISALYAPSLGRHDRFRPMGPIVGVVEAP
jgi:uncharacterized protein YigE (DUF2233 family)